MEDRTSQRKSRGKELSIFTSSTVLYRKRNRNGRAQDVWPAASRSASRYTHLDEAHKKMALRIFEMREKEFQKVYKEYQKSKSKE